MVTNRKKGHDYEREIANRFRLAGWLHAKRHLEFQQAECKGYDLDGTDPFRIQCKCTSTYVPINTIQDIHPSPTTTPLLISKPDVGRAVAVLYLDDLMRILSVCKAKGVDLSPPSLEDF